MPEDQTDDQSDDQTDAPAGDAPAAQPKKPRKRRAASPPTDETPRLPFSGYVEPNGACTITIGDGPAWVEPNVTLALRNLKVDLVELMQQDGYKLGF